MADHHPDYEFIMNPGGPAPKKPLVPMASGNSMKQRIIIVVGGAVALLLVAVIAISIISSAGNAGKEELLKVAQQQNEIIRVSKIGVERARGATAKNLATTTAFSLQSDQTALFKAAKSSGTTIDPKLIGLSKNARTDTALTSADQSNRFDEAFIETIQAQLTNYQASLKSAYDNASNDVLKKSLETQYTNAGLLATAKQ